MMEKTVVVNGSRWAHKTSGKLYKILDFRAKTSTVLIEPVDGSEKPKSITTSTLKRLYNPLEEAGKEVKEEKKEDSKAKAEKPVKEPSKKSEKKAEPKAPKKDRNAVAMSYTERARKVAEGLGYATNTYKGMPTDLVVRADKKRLFEIYFSNKNIKVYTNSNRVPEGVEYKTVKSSFDASVPLAYPENDKDFEKFVKSILAWEVA